MSTITKNSKLNKRIVALSESAVFKNILEGLGDHEILSIGVQGKYKQEDVKYLQSIGHKASVVEDDNKQKFDLLICYPQINKNTSEFEKDDLMYELGQISNFWSFVCVPKDHKLFDGLVPEEPRGDNFDWYLI